MEEIPLKILFEESCAEFSFEFSMFWIWLEISWAFLESFEEIAEEKIGDIWVWFKWIVAFRSWKMVKISFLASLNLTKTNLSLLLITSF